MRSLLRDGSLQRVTFAHAPEELPASHYERVHLNDLLKAVHSKIDANGDGIITRAELQRFLSTHRLEHLSPLLDSGPAPEAFAFADFQKFVLDTHLLSLERDAAHGEREYFAAHASLVGVLSECFFDRADVRACP